MYKVLDLRTGECLKHSDIYWSEQDAHYYSIEEALEVINSILKNRSYNPYPDVPKLIREYFEIVEI